MVSTPHEPEIFSHRVSGYPGTRILDMIKQANTEVKVQEEEGHASLQSSRKSL